ncbi:MAG: CBS domain-containing protein [Anaerolineales bacterium]|nr:CBS domain-containing protein [Anaerolineales bacterium]
MKQKISLPGQVSRWLDRWQPSEYVILGGAALLVGLTSGAGVWLFKQLIELAHTLAFGEIGPVLTGWGYWTVMLIPVLGGLGVGLMLHFWIGPERHHGVAGIMEAVALAGGRLRYQRIPAKATAAALSIGSGASVGPEDPSVQIGANLGSMFGQLLRLSDDRVRALVAAGAAGGIAAAFNAPIAGLFFALEIILGEVGSNAMGVVILAAVISAVFTQAVSGPEPAFHIPAYAFHSAWELPLYLGLGLLSGPIAALYIRLIYLAQDIFHGWAAPRWLKPASAGLAVGLVGLFLPQVFGIGYETIEQTLGNASLAVPLLLVLLVAKLILTPVSIGGGFPGGVFAPSLFLGATLGAAYGQMVEGLFPNLQLDPPAFALVGMAAVLAGTVHAPLTAIILLFEMTNDYHIILPLMFAVVVSLLISQRLQPDSVYALGLARKGIRLQRGRDVEVLDAITVGEVMQTETPFLHETDPVETAAEVLMQTRHHGLPVLDAAGALAGIFTVQDLEQAQQIESKQPLTVGQVCTRELLTAYPDEAIGVALRRMGTRDIGRLPVIARNNPRQLLGLLRRADLVRAYDIALTRRAAVRHRTQQVRLGAFSGTEVEEFTIKAGAPCIGHSIHEVNWPRSCVIASIRRGRQLLIPHGDTVIQAGDVLITVVEGHAHEELRRLCLPDSRN